MESLPRITVLLPVYNGEKYIRTAIKSILSQTFSNYELYIVDDGSTDFTKNIIDEFADARIRYERIEHSGLPATLNYGLQHASCDIVARMDADDISLPRRLEKQLKVFVTMPENTVMSCRYVLFDKDGIRGVVNGPIEHAEIVKRLVLHNELTHSGIMYNRKFILGEGGYSIVPFEDFALWLKLRLKANFIIVPNILSCARVDYTSLARKHISIQNRLVYNLLEPIYANENFPEEFDLNTKEEADIMRGWREYFYGDASLAREHWRKHFKRVIKTGGLLLAYMATYIPGKAFIRFKESRLRFRSEYYFRYSHELSTVESSLCTIRMGEGSYDER